MVEVHLVAIPAIAKVAIDARKAKAKSSDWR